MNPSVCQVAQGFSCLLYHAEELNHPLSQYMRVCVDYHACR